MTPRFTLRPYQKESIQAVVEARKRGVKRMVICLPTGTGKTVIFSNLARMAKHQVLVLAHRSELLAQAREKIEQALGPEGGLVAIEQGDRRAPKEAKVIVCSIRSLHEGRLGRVMAGRDIRLVIYDECHHAAADDNMRVLEQLGAFEPDWPGTLLGFTATTIRGDGKGLDDVFEEIVYSSSLTEMIRDGFLSPLRGYRITTAADLRAISPGGLDFNEGELGEAVDIETRNGLVARSILELARDRRTIVFCVTVNHAKNLARTMNHIGLRTGIVFGEMHAIDRARTLAEFRAGRFQALTNVGVLTEGFDDPEVSCIAMARPTRSEGYYAQCLDEETEILTERGFVGIDAIRATDRVAGYSTDDSTVEWVDVLRVFRRPLAVGEKLFSLQSPSVDFRVTGGHRMVYKTKRKNSKWRVVDATYLAGLRAEYVIPVAGYQTAAGVSLSDDELRFVGWFLTDGSLNKANNQIVITQAEHQPHHEAIEGCLKGCGFKYGVNNVVPNTQFNATSRRIVYYVSKGKPRGTDKHLRGWSLLEPYLDKDFSPHLEKLDRRQLGVLLEAIHLGDGAKQRNQSWTRRSYHITTVNKTFADRLQSICIRRGYRSNVASFKTPAGKPAYLIHIKDRSVRYVGGIGYSDRPVIKESPPQRGERVWCVENELKTLVVRRNGKTMIVGNCVGRGTRLFPGKEDCLVLDFVDLANLNLVTLPTLFGMPGNVDLEGQEAGEAQENYRQLLMDLPGFDLDEAESLTLLEIRERTEAFDPLTLDIDPEVMAISENAWVSLGKPGLALHFQPRKGRISTFVILDASASVGGRGKKYRVLLDGKELARFSRVTQAVEAVDFELQKKGYRIAESGKDYAAWRFEDPPSEVALRLNAMKPRRQCQTHGEALRLLAWDTYANRRKPSTGR